jgi:hypothetical protein
MSVLNLGGVGMDDTNKTDQGLEDFPLSDNHEESAKQRPSNRAHLPESAQPHPRASGALWVTFIILAICLVGVAGYDYSVLKAHNLRLAQLPSLVDSVTWMGKRVDAAEAKLATWAGERDALVKRMGGLERTLNASMRRARKETQAMIAQAQTRWQQQLDEKARVVDARLSQLQSEQEAERVRLAKLRDEVSSVRQELAAAREDAGNELASLGERQTANQDRIQGISSRLERQRLDFEVVKNKTREVATGISLNIKQTNVSYQRFAGWLTYVPDSRTIWIEDGGVQRPIVFRPKQGGEPIEVVVTSVQKNGVLGYVLQPVIGNTGARVSTRAEAGRRGTFQAGQ